MDRPDPTTEPASKVDPSCIPAPAASLVPEQPLLCTCGKWYQRGTPHFADGEKRHPCAQPPARVPDRCGCNQSYLDDTVHFLNGVPHRRCAGAAHR